MTKAAEPENANQSAFFSDNPARPAQQERSRKRHADLIDAGLVLLREKDFDEIPVSAIAAQAGCAVGSFYTRFSDKQAYFGALQQHVLSELGEQSDAWFAAQPWAEMSVREACDHLIGWLSTHIVEQRAVIRAAYKHNQNQPGVWTPMKAIGQQWTASAAKMIVHRLDHLPLHSREQQFTVAMQFFYGAMINAVINDPGPLKLGSDELPHELARAFAGYLQIPLS